MSTVLTLHDPRTARQYYESGVWQDQTMYTLLQSHARARPNDWALRDSSRRLTWAQLLEWTDAVAADLAAAGLRKSSRVSIWLPSRVESVVVFLACSRNGYICNPSLHQNYTVAEIVRLIERIDCEAFVGEKGYGADAKREGVIDQIAAVKSLRRTYWLDPARTDETGFPKAGENRPSSMPDDNADKVVYLAFTSGTTGLPKAVLHSDNTLLANGRAMVKDWAHNHNTILLSLSPVSHHIATVSIEQMLVAGMELVLNDLPSGMKPIDWILETGATYVMGVPTHAMDILAEAKQRGLDKLGNVKVFYMAGAAIPREIAQGFLNRGILPQNVYGMTENGSHQYTLPTDNTDTIVGTCGRACDAYEVRLWNQENPDIEAKPGETGEIGGRGGCLMLGYFNNQSATEKSFNAHGWFLSGDLGKFDENGCLVIIGRKKDLIIRGGHNIYPATIEDLAITHPAVLKAAAFPVADDRLGEKVCLAITCPEGASPPMGEEILKHLHDVGLSKFDMPEYYVSLDAFPQTASGKILKRELIEWVKQGRLTPTPVRWQSTENKVTEKVN
ncbi:class I adenylate-forming enzyme family protein [Noviherbaspirillum sp. Root189]|uniref:class I adenylate-forming enzyme family protein n=1 Tax=Noviherbaspirillum sp. Root189 TaxID=1736487 RepID=UPI0007097D44|nr:class I adenylate-forming enzyme family protein [Noviherbaspirillum sp. Root189]KRB70596.1 AMP-dependent synthetase [Noviherbaspirillum sp. Root189]